MKSPKDNIFTSFRGPGIRENEGRLGSQLEDNTTKALLHVIDYGNAEIERAVLSALTAQTASHSAITKVLSQNDRKIETETQVRIQDIPRNGRELLFVGVSDRGIDPLETTENPEINPEDPDTSEKRVDGLIHIEDESGNKFTIVEESKFGGSTLEISDTGDYKATLDIPDEQYHTISWLEIYEELGTVLADSFRLESSAEPASDRASFIAEEFMRYLQIYGLTLSQSESTYGEDDEGVNTVSLEFQPDMNVRTDEAKDGLVEYAVHFDTVGANGYLDIYVTQNEWEALLGDLERSHEDARIYLKEGDSESFFEYIDTEINPSSRTKIAEIGEKETGRKWLQVVPKDDHYVLGIKYASPGKEEPSNGYFMLAEHELEDHFEGSSGSSNETAFQSLFAAEPDIRNLR